MSTTTKTYKTVIKGYQLPLPEDNKWNKYRLRFQNSFERKSFGFPEGKKKGEISWFDSSKVGNWCFIEVNKDTLSFDDYWQKRVDQKDLEIEYDDQELEYYILESHCRLAPIPKIEYKSIRFLD